jgi:hypothetical protein
MGTRMILNIRIEDQSYPVEVPEAIVTDAGEFFTKLDADMDQGWQMSRSWVDNPSPEQRCQIVADKILGAFEHDNKKSLILYSAYILSRMPTLKTLDISTNGEMQETLFEFE